jgi:membrane-associated phospholipid phosphatase
MAVAYGALAAAVSVWPRSWLDLAIADVLQRATALDGVLHAASMFGFEPYSILLPVLAIAALLAVRAWREALWLAMSVLGAAGIETASKLAIVHVRPSATQVVRELAIGNGYPSGHVTSYLALFGFLAVVAHERIHKPALRRAAIAAAVSIIALVGLSRVYLGAHWPSDVVGGYLGAGAWLVCVAHGYRASGLARPATPA